MPKTKIERTKTWTKEKKKTTSQCSYILYVECNEWRRLYGRFGLYWGVSTAKRYRVKTSYDTIFLIWHAHLSVMHFFPHSSYIFYHLTFLSFKIYHLCINIHIYIYIYNRSNIVYYWRKQGGREYSFCRCFYNISIPAFHFNIPSFR